MTLAPLLMRKAVSVQTSVSSWKQSRTSVSSRRRSLTPPFISLLISSYVCSQPFHHSGSNSRQCGLLCADRSRQTHTQCLAHIYQNTVHVCSFLNHIWWGRPGFAQNYDPNVKIFNIFLSWITATYYSNFILTWSSQEKYGFPTYAWEYTGKQFYSKE